MTLTGRELRRRYWKLRRARLPMLDLGGGFWVAVRS